MSVYFVFQTSCAALTLIRAVSPVKGGTGGLVAVAIVNCEERMKYFGCWG